MSDNNLQSCPICNQGVMRPTGKAGTDRNIHEPFSETSDARRYECDNCGHVQSNAKMTEGLGVSDSVSASVEKNPDLNIVEKNPDLNIEPAVSTTPSIGEKDVALHKEKEFVWGAKELSKKGTIRFTSYDER